MYGIQRRVVRAAGINCPGVEDNIISLLTCTRPGKEAVTSHDLVK
jgi:hypothetical protein